MRAHFYGAVYEYVNKWNVGEKRYRVIVVSLHRNKNDVTKLRVVILFRQKQAIRYLVK